MSAHVQAYVCVLFVDTSLDYIQTHQVEDNVFLVQIHRQNSIFNIVGLSVITPTSRWLNALLALPSLTSTGWSYLALSTWSLSFCFAYA